MHVSYVSNQRLVGCLFPDYPLSGKWAESALARTRLWMEEAAPKGEWPENTHYTADSQSPKRLHEYAAPVRSGSSQRRHGKLH